MARRILVTGSTGFIGRRVSKSLHERGLLVVRAVRSSHLLESDGLTTVPSYPVGNISQLTDWQAALKGVDTVIHLAALAHQIHHKSSASRTTMRTVNTLGTKRLASQAAEAGVKRFIFLSSVKVHGEESQGDRAGKRVAFSEKDTPNPVGSYAISKWEAEQELHEIAKNTAMEVVILRSPLVYGPGVRANFFRLIHLVDRGFPLPFRALDNRRSMIFIDNLVEFISLCVEHPAAAGETFLVSDEEALSTPTLIRHIAASFNRTPCLFSCPRPLLRVVGNILCKGKEIDRLLGSLVVDTGKSRRILAWQPRHSIQEGLKETVLWYRKR